MNHGIMNAIGDGDYEAVHLIVEYIKTRCPLRKKMPGEDMND